MRCLIDGRCFGYIGLEQDNIDELKKICETYREEMYCEKGEQTRL